MNILKHNLASSKRHGLSVIEVLTSIVVALIGVFGVLAMIPFSVKQTQSGLDQDAATSMARSALSSFEAGGYKIVSGDNSQLGWVTDAAGTAVSIDSDPDALYCIDPLGVAEQDRVASGTAFGTFPFNSTGGAVMIPIVNLATPPDGLPRAAGTLPQFDLADARRMFRLTDDLVFEESDDSSVTDSDLFGPVQIFNEGSVGGAVTLLNRQSTGAVSWCAIVQPIVNDPTAAEVDSYKFNVLIFKDRITDSTATESQMATATVTMPTNFASPLSSVTVGGPMGTEIRRNDWVMLYNESGTVTNVAFARISSLNDVAPLTPLFESGSSLTLDGPDFDFGNGTTTIVHLRDVVAVFPRTIKLESLSEWNVN